MRGLIAAFVIAVACVSPVAAQDAPSTAATLPTIVTSGEAFVRRAPDVAFITLAVESRAKSPREAQRLNAEAMSGVQRRIAAAGIARDALQTRGVWLEQEFDSVGGRRVARGFVARNTLEVRLDDVSRAGEVADAVVEAGATSLSGIRFDLKDRSAAERDALRLAVADARGRADAAAAGAGRSVDRIIKIEDSRMQSYPPRPMMTMAKAEIGATTDIEPGLIEIQAHVTLTVLMK